MHHFKASGGTSVNFNGDLSGDAHVSVGPDRAQYGHALIPCSDLMEIVDYWRGLAWAVLGAASAKSRLHHEEEEEDAEGQLEEQLTEEERVSVNIKMLSGGKDAIAKLLRIHDRLKARVAELDPLFRAVDATARIHTIASLDRRTADALQCARGGIDDQFFDGTCSTCGQRYHPPG